MKSELGIVLLVFALVLTATFFVYHRQEARLTGFVVEGESLGVETEDIEEEVVMNKTTALEAINEAEQIIEELNINNFSTIYMDDSLIEMNRFFDKSRYEDVFINLRDIRSRKEKAFLLQDKIIVEKNKLGEVSDETKEIFNKAKSAFDGERYDEADDLLLEFRQAFEKERADLSTFSGLRNNTKNFIQRYWLFILIILIIGSVSGYFLYKKFEKKILKRKINKMHVERKALVGLMKKNQIQRFKENKVSKLVYNIRMKKYKERLQSIKQELPVLEARFIKKVKKEENKL